MLITLEYCQYLIVVEFHAYHSWILSVFGSSKIPCLSANVVFFFVYSMIWGERWWFVDSHCLRLLSIISRGTDWSSTLLLILSLILTPKTHTCITNYCDSNWESLQNKFVFEMKTYLIPHYQELVEVITSWINWNKNRVYYILE
jgi:hypothetical protein